MTLKTADTFVFEKNGSRDGGREAQYGLIITGTKDTKKKRTVTFSILKLNK